MHLIHPFIYMPMPAVPRLVVRHLFDFVQPFLGAAVHFALVNAGKKHLNRHVFQRAGVGEDHVKRFYPHLLFHVPLDFLGGLLVFLPTVSPKLTADFVHAVGAADHQVPGALNVVNLAVFGK